MRRLAIVPARGGSKRLPRKNILNFLGVPAMLRPLRAARESGVFDDIVVSTEDAEIARVARADGFEVLSRPDDLASDSAGIKDVCLQAMDELERQGRLPDVFCCIFATSVLINAEDLAQSGMLLHREPEPDFVMGISEYPIHPYKALEIREGFLTPVWPEENVKKSQEFPQFFCSNGTFVWARTRAFRDAGGFYGRRLAGYPVPSERAVDIDTAEDFARAEIIAKGLGYGPDKH